MTSDYTASIGFCIQNDMQASVEIVEVGPRDGLQNEPGVIETADKVALINRSIDYGARRIEVASFVNPRRVPQMADGEAVIAALPDDKRVTYIGLCLNERGVERAIASRANGRGIDEAGCVLVATDSFGIANQGQTVAEGVVANRAMIAMAKAAGMRAQLTIPASFGCPFEGPVPQARVLDIAETMAEAGAEEIAFADTIGVGVPAQVGEMLERAFERLGKGFPLRVHLHDTRGLGTANAWAAYLAGCRVFDSSLGGLGGCPFAPGAKGNVATEELTYMFVRSGIETGIDLGKALSVNSWFGGIMGRPLPSRVGQAGDFTVKQREVA
jgi:hydroxymethylglutaryl-CoA lyase